MPLFPGTSLLPTGHFPSLVRCSRSVGARCQPMDHAAARAYILDRLVAELPDNLWYHAYHHTLDVMHAAERIARREDLPEEDVQLVMTAAAYHDSGFLKTYDNNEHIGADMASEALPAFGFEPEAIARVREMILATNMPQQPQSHLARILCDADLDYLGRDDFFAIGHTLKRELAHHGHEFDLLSWYRLQEQFLASHAYFTTTAKAEREPKKRAHLQQVRDLLASRE